MGNNAQWLILQKLRTPLLVIIVTYSIAILGMVLIPGVDDNGKPYDVTFFDAFYFVSYMASTIGFGESPYAFTYAQKLWVSICIYLTVIGWFYGVGSLVSALTDKTLQSELMRQKFRKKVKRISNPFVIILGYTYVNAEIIRKLHSVNIEAVLIDKEEEKINHFLLEESGRYVPVLIADGVLSETLIDAGIKKNNCKAIVSLFEDEEKSLRVSILTKFLNPRVNVLAKGTFKSSIKSMLDTDITKVLNPFEIFAKRLDISLSSPHILVLENWIYQNSDLENEAQFLPKGKYIICGYGRWGERLQEKFDKHNMEYVFIDEKRMANLEMIDKGQFIRANPDDKDILLEAGIEKASGLIIGTKNDIVNLSILITAKKLNPNIYVIVRENTIQDVSLFQAAEINWVFMIERILINKSSLLLSKPLKHSFLKLILKKDESWAIALVQLLSKKIGTNPKLMALKINEEQSYAIHRDLKKGKKINVDILLHSLSDRKKYNKAIPLLIHRKNEHILLPRDRELEIDDHLLIACDEKSKEDIEYIASNIYELHYACCGEEKQTWLWKKLQGKS